MKPIISPVGDCAISIDFGQVIDPKINRHIRQTIERIQELNLEGIIELVPTYCALLLQYDAMLYSYAELCNIIEPTLEQTVTNLLPSWKFPPCTVVSLVQTLVL